MLWKNPIQDKIDLDIHKKKKKKEKKYNRNVMQYMIHNKILNK